MRLMSHHTKIFSSNVTWCSHISIKSNNVSYYVAHIYRKYVDLEGKI